jgi:hypothetical protein
VRHVDKGRPLAAAEIINLPRGLGDRRSWMAASATSSLKM